MSIHYPLQATPRFLLDLEVGRAGMRRRMGGKGREGGKGGRDGKGREGGKR